MQVERAGLDRDNGQDEGPPAVILPFARASDRPARPGSGTSQFADLAVGGPEIERLREDLEAVRAERDDLRRRLAVATHEITQLRIAVAAESDLRLQAAHGWALERDCAGALEARLVEIQRSRFWRYSRVPRSLLRRARQLRLGWATERARRRPA